MNNIFPLASNASGGKKRKAEADQDGLQKKRIKLENELNTKEQDIAMTGSSPDDPIVIEDSDVGIEDDFPTEVDNWIQDTDEATQQEEEARTRAQKKRTLDRLDRLYWEKYDNWREYFDLHSFNSEEVKEAICNGTFTMAGCQQNPIITPNANPPSKGTRSQGPAREQFVDITIEAFRGENPWEF